MKDDVKLIVFLVLILAQRMFKLCGLEHTMVVNDEKGIRLCSSVVEQTDLVYVRLQVQFPDTKIEVNNK